MDRGICPVCRHFKKIGWHIGPYTDPTNAKSSDVKICPRKRYTFNQFLGQFRPENVDSKASKNNPTNLFRLCTFKATELGHMKNYDARVTGSRSREEKEQVEGKREKLTSLMT